MDINDLPLQVFMATALITGNQIRGFLLDNECFVSPPCSCFRSEIDCGGKGLTAMPTFKPASVSKSYLFIYLNNNYLTTIYDYAFPNISSDTGLDIHVHLGNNLISRMSELCFRGIEHSLNEMVLKNNSLTSLPRAFAHLTHLEKLYLDRNPLVSLNADTMDKIGYNNLMKHFRIDLTYFKAWPVEISSLRFLQVLEIYSVPFHHLNQSAFQGFEGSLSELSLSNTHLEEMPTAICNLIELEYLYFENNGYLSDHALHNEDCLQNLSKLRSLSLGNNSLVDFPIVLGNDSLYYRLNFSNNHIRTIKNDSITGGWVTILILYNNELTRIPYVLNKLTYIEYLDLDNNNIVSIGEHDIENLQQIEFLSLYNNKIEFISDNAFKNNGKLRTLYISKNLLKTIPAAISFLTGIQIVDLNNNEIDCSCSSFDFEKWNISGIAIEGHCKNGLQSLKNFVASMSQVCR